MEQGVIALLGVKKVLVGCSLLQGHLVVGVEETGQGVEGRDILLYGEVGGDPGLPVPEDEAPTHKDCDEHNPNRNSCWGHTPSKKDTYTYFY